MAPGADFISVAFASLSLLLLRGGGLEASTRMEGVARSAAADVTSVCRRGFMSVYVPKRRFDDLPFNIYVQDEAGGFHQALAVAERCNYTLGETEAFSVLTVASGGCFVRHQDSSTRLTVVILALADSGGVEIIKWMPVICERKVKELNHKDHPSESRHITCSRHGFDITIPQNATVPPLNLDAVWILSNQSQCKSQKRSDRTVTFSFPFTSCGTRSLVANGILTYWVNLQVGPRPQRGSVFHETPFHFTVHCSFALDSLTQLDLEVQGEKNPPTLKGEGPLRTEMRFAKAQVRHSLHSVPVIFETTAASQDEGSDSTFRSFYSPRGPPVMTELGLPVFVDVSVLKHRDEGLTLLLDDCWATPTEHPDDPRRWNLLTKGCPHGGDRHRTVVLPVVSGEGLKYPSLHKRFLVHMFSFVKPKEEENLVYFHCEVEICKGPVCSRSCSSGPSGRRKTRRIPPAPAPRGLYGVVSGGPLGYLL